MPLTRISLRRRLPLLIGALLLAVTAVLSWVAYWGFRNALLAAAQTRLSSAADLLAGLIETSAQQLITTARAGAARPSTVAYFHHPDARTGTAALAALAVKDNPNATTPAPDVELLDPRGERLLSSAANPRGYGKIDPGALRAAAGPDSGVVGRFHAARDSAWYPTVAPVFFQARLAGYVVFWRRLSGTAKAKTQLNQLIGQGGTATIYFGNTAGDVWTDQTAIVPGPPVTLTADTGLMQYTRPGSEGAVLAEARPVRKAPWTVLVEFPRAVVLAPVRQFRRYLLLMTLVIIGVGLACVWLLSTSVTRPLDQLMTSVAAGDYTKTQAIAARHDELGRLADVFRTMSATVQAEENARLIVDGAYDAFIAMDERGTITGWNRQAEKTFGWSRDEALGRVVAETIIPPAQREAHRNGLRHYLATGEGPVLGRAIELTAMRRDGTEFPVELTITPLRVGDKHVFAAFVRDITHRKQAEAELERYAAELENANRELDAFAYSVSHDLRAPLRSIDGFSQALLEDYGERLDDGGKGFLQRVRDGSKRMALLIDDLLRLSRVNRTEMRRESVDLSAIARAIASELAQSDPARQVEFAIAPGLTATGDAQLLRVALQNLLSNGWKYTAKRPHPHIEFGATVSDGKTTYYVRDDGAGFDMAYADKLFGAFQRLHSPGEFEGSGIGLATVRRIIGRHGGRVWAEGVVDRGATFYFSL